MIRLTSGLILGAPVACGVDLKDLIAFVERENSRLHDQYTTLAETSTALAQTVKLSEETGELSDAVLASQSLQRPANPADPDLDEEFADVVLTACLLADTAGIDIEAALAKKVDTIEERYE